VEFIAPVCVKRGADTWLFYFAWLVKFAGLRLYIGETVSKLVRQFWCGSTGSHRVRNRYTYLSKVVEGTRDVMYVPWCGNGNSTVAFFTVEADVGC
jgi:hypothetical protein